MSGKQFVLVLCLCSGWHQAGAVSTATDSRSLDWPYRLQAGEVELSAAPADEPDPATGEIVELSPPPQAEPPPTPTEIVELSPPPATEPAPGAAPVPAPVVELAVADALAAELRALRDEDDDAPQRHHRTRRQDDADDKDSRRDPGQWGLCGNPGPGLRSGFTIDGYEFTLRWIDRTLHGVIANHCQSKTYRDILALDGGTVGISHFASGSLLTLYGQMDTGRYFGDNAHRIPDRPYEHAWWLHGMRRFLDSPEAKIAQQRAWRAYISPALSQALQHGWRTERALAIAASVANSLGAYGFSRLAMVCGWDAERTLRLYATLSAHKERRRQRLNAEFPPTT